MTNRNKIKKVILEYLLKSWTEYWDPHDNMFMLQDFLECNLKLNEFSTSFRRIDDYYIEINVECNDDIFHFHLLSKSPERLTL